MAQRKTDRRELRPGLAEYDTEQRSVNDLRGLFLVAVKFVEPRVLESLEAIALGIYRQFFRGESTSLTREQLSKVAQQTGFADEVASIDELESSREANLRYPEVIGAILPLIMNSERKCNGTV